MVQFLKKKHSDTLDFLKKLEPELQIFRFEKAACGYSDLSPKEKQEQMLNIKNALGYSRKVLDTGQCDLLILDEIFGLVDYNIITIEDDSWCHSLGYCHGYRNCCSCRWFPCRVLRQDLSGW